VRRWLQGVCFSFDSVQTLWAKGQPRKEFEAGEPLAVKVTRTVLTMHQKGSGEKREAAQGG